MAVGYSALLKLPKPVTGQSAWATYMQALADMADARFGGVCTVTKVTGSTTLPDANGVADSSKAFLLQSSVTLTGNVNVIVPALRRWYLAYNNTSGAFTWTVKTPSGTGIAVKQGRKMWLYCDGTNVVAIGRHDGALMATEFPADILTATAVAGNPLKDGVVTTGKIANAAVTLAKFAGAISYGRILYSGTGAGFPYNTLPRGTAGQVLAMATSGNPLPSWRTPPLSRIATSTEILITDETNAVYQFSHGLGVVPAIVFADLVCKSADNNHSAGDIVQFGGSGGSAGVGADVEKSTTQVGFRCSVNGPAVINKSSGNTTAITANKWAIVFRCLV